MKALTLIFLSIFASTLSAASRGEVILQADFDAADLSGWRTAGDLCVAPAFCAGRPQGQYWVALSTNDSSDSITMCGGSSLKGLQSVLRSPDVALPFKPSKIRIEFYVKFLTNENTDTDLGTDHFSARLLTKAGPVTIVSIDDSGPSPESKNLTISGSSTFKDSACASNWRYETDFLKVSYYRTFREPVTSKMATGPLALEFALNNSFDSDFDSAVVVDDVRLTVYP